MAEKSFMDRIRSTLAENGVEVAESAYGVSTLPKVVALKFAKALIAERDGKNGEAEGWLNEALAAL